MIATRFSVALHILILVATASADEATSARMALSVGTNPVVVRRIARQLARAGLIRATPGQPRALARQPQQITLRDVWRAIHPEPEKLIPVHPRTNKQDVVGNRMPGVLRRLFDDAEGAMLSALNRITIADLVTDLSEEGSR